MLSLRAVLVYSLLVGCDLSAAPESKPVFFYASRAGQPTLDADARGGNPFATALVRSLTLSSLSFAAFKADLIARTRDASRGVQQVEIIGGDDLARWQFLPKPSSESWVALVVVFADYSASRVGQSLPGAKRDHRRVSEALARAGFAVMPLLDPDEKTLAQTLSEFAARSAHADVAVVYTTGHGVEADGIARVLLPYTTTAACRALSVTELSKTARAKRANLIFYAACRNRP
jgi:hypothetical protein